MSFRHQVTLIATCVTVAGCTAQHATPRSKAIMHTDTSVPSATAFTSAPLRHRLRVELNAPVPEVWTLVGQHVRLPEYSEGIASVEVDEARGAGRVRVCHFRSPDGAGTGPTLREQI